MKASRVDMRMLGVLLFGFLQPEAIAPNDPLLTSYLRLLERYRAGSAEDAARELLGWSTRRVASAASRLEEEQEKQSKKRWNDEGVRFFDLNVRTAAVLHTQAGAFEGARSKHFEIARKFLDRVRDEQAQKRLLRDWLLVVASYHFLLLEEEEALRYLGEAERLFPDDPDVLLLAGSFHEGIGSLVKDTDRIRRAERYYRAILKSHPAHVEAHLRWGRVLFVRGDAAAAGREFSWTLSHTEDKTLRYLALVFQGDLLESEERFQEATASYRSAAEVEPQSQVAYLALAHVLYREGDRRGAGQALEHVFRRNAFSPKDGWWQYLLGSANWWDAALEEMRQELLR